MTIEDLPEVERCLLEAYNQGRPPIAELIRAQTSDPFRILVATILSARTRDATTAAAVERLFADVASCEDLRGMSIEDIEQRIRPVGFFHQKARHLKALPEALDSLFNGCVPDSVEALCRLPGVGRKTANLVVAVAFGQPAICVDVHVHRISNRFGLIATTTPFETETTLRRILPARYWARWNRHLVAFGQTRCLPRNPRCGDCPLRNRCSRVGLPESKQQG